jgi:acylphosphatase
MASTTQRFLFTGRVQGVGFRWTTERIARRFPVTGFVRNLVSGQVELVVCGEMESVEALILAIKQRFEGHIGGIDREEMPGHAEFSDFCIQR